MGVDAAKAESVVNLTGSRSAVMWGANSFLAAAIATFAGALHVAVRRRRRRRRCTLAPDSKRLGPHWRYAACVAAQQAAALGWGLDSMPRSVGTGLGRGQGRGLLGRVQGHF